MASIELIKPVPDQVVNAGAAYKPLDLKQFIHCPDAHTQVRYRAALEDGRAVPQGLGCAADGVFSGIPGHGTEGTYVVAVTVQDVMEGEELQVRFNLLIKPANRAQQDDLLKDLKTQVWEAVGKGEPLPTMPELSGIFNWPVTAFDIYYLLERFAYLTIWDAYNMDAPGKCLPLNLKSASALYQVVDRGSCIVASPKDLFSNERTPNDALITARAMAEEVHKRGWTIEFSGFDKMVRAAWVRLQVLGKQQNKFTEILHYAAPAEDTLIYTREVGAMSDQKPTI